MSKKLNQKTIEIRSEEIEDILGRKPAWLLRRGILILSLIIFLLLIASWFFKYPDIITAPMIITSSNPPEQILARVNGKISTLFVSNNQHIDSNSYLAVISNSADFNSILKLKNLFTHFDINSANLVIKSNKVEQIEGLGDLQQSYQHFMQSFLNYQRFITLSHYAKRINSLLSQKKISQSYLNELRVQQSLQQSNLEISKKRFISDSLLFANNITAPVDYDNAKLLLTNEKIKFNNTEISLSNALLQLNQLEQQILDLTLSSEKESKQYSDEVINSL